MKKYDTYLFDVDGTLIDTAELIFQCFKYSCKKFADVDISRDVVMKHIGLPFKGQLDRYIGETTEMRCDEVFTEHMKYQATQYKKYLKAFDSVSELLDALVEKNIKIGIVTSRKKDSLLPYLNETGLGDYFKVIISPEDTVNHKPYPEPIEAALNKLKSKPETCIYIGDSIYDIEAGSRAGCDTAFVSWSNIDASECHIKPTYVIDSPLDLIQ